MSAHERAGRRPRTWVDGVEDGSIPADDDGLLMGLTVFETMRTYGGEVFRLGQHLDRLEASARQLEIAVPPRSQMIAEIEAAIERDVSLRYHITAGGHRILRVAPIDPARIGANMCVATLDWEPGQWLPGAVKHGSRAAWIIAARRIGVDEVLLVDHAGYLLEANRSNIFGVRNGVIRTPPLDGRFLEGVTRGALLEAAGRKGIPANEEPLHKDAPLDELYLSSTLKELAPVIEMDAQPAPGRGPVGDALYDAFRALVREETGSALALRAR